MTTAGIIGSGQVGSNLAKAAVAHGYEVVITSSRGRRRLPAWRPSSDPRPKRPPVAGLLQAHLPARVRHRQNVAELKANVAKAERGLDRALTPVPDA
jgi:predicted dinucleotide-binding enzyme